MSGLTSHMRSTTAYKQIISCAKHFSVRKPYRSAGEKVAEEAEHLHDDVHLGVGKQTKQVVTAKSTQHL